MHFVGVPTLPPKETTFVTYYWLLDFYLCRKVADDIATVFTMVNKNDRNTLHTDKTRQE